MGFLSPINGLINVTPIASRFLGILTPLPPCGLLGSFPQCSGLIRDLMDQPKRCENSGSIKTKSWCNYYLCHSNIHLYHCNCNYVVVTDGCGWKKNIFPKWWLKWWFCMVGHFKSSPLKTSCCSNLYSWCLKRKPLRKILASAYQIGSRLPKARAK